MTAPKSPELAGTLWASEEAQRDGKAFLVDVLRPATYAGPTPPNPEQVVAGVRLRYKGVTLRPERWERWKILAANLKEAKDLLRRRFARLADHRWVENEAAA